MNPILSMLANIGPMPMYGGAQNNTGQPLVAPRPGFRQRFGSALTGARNRLFGAPEGLDQLLSPEAINQARGQGVLGLGASLLESSGWQDGPAPTMGQAVGRAIGAGQQAYGGALDTALGVAQEAQTARAAQQREQQRAAIAAKFPIHEGMSTPEINRNLRALFNAYASAGDTEMMQRMSEVVKGLPDESAVQKRQPVETQDLGNKVWFFDPNTGEQWYEDKGAAPRDPNAPNPAADAARQRRFSNEGTLADDFRASTKNHAIVADQVRVITGLGEDMARTGGKMTPAGQMSLIFAYMKLLDPNSSVRETEYANAQNTAGVPQRVRNIWNKMKDGRFLDDDTQVQDFLNEAKNSARAWQRSFDTLSKHYTRRAQAWEVEPTRVIIDYFEGLREDGPAGAGTAGPPSKYR